MRSHGGKSGAGRGSGRGMKTRKRVGRRPGCGAENFSAGRGRSAVARKTSRQVGRGSGVSAVREPRLPRGKSVGGAPAFRPQVGRCFCGGAENFSAGRARKRRLSGAGTTAAARKICRRSSGIPAAGRTIRQLAGRCFGGTENMAGIVTVPAAANLSAGLRPCPKLPLRPPPPVMAATPPR